MESLALADAPKNLELDLVRILDSLHEEAKR
jgi:hypothetical protein